MQPVVRMPRHARASGVCDRLTNRSITHSIDDPSQPSRRLADKIKTARINKERADQLVEKQTLRSQAAEYDRAFNQYLEQNDAAAVAREAANQAQRRDNAVKARQMLEDQMAEKQVRVWRYGRAARNNNACARCTRGRGDAQRRCVDMMTMVVTAAAHLGARNGLQAQLGCMRIHRRCCCGCCGRRQHARVIRGT